MTRYLHSWRQKEALLGVGLFVAALLLYVRTMAPTVAAVFDDSLEFPLVVHRLAIAHPTGYPLYTLLGKVFSFLPIGDVAYRLHLFSAVAAACAVVMLYVAARRMGLRPLGGLAAAACLVVSPVFWSQALIAEVYALNALFVAAILALAIALGEGRRSWRTVVALALVFGLSQTHHRTAALLAPAVAVYLIVAWRVRAGGSAEIQRPAWPRGWPLIVLLALVLPLLLYLYIPWRGATISSLDGIYTNTLSTFLSWVSGSMYSTFLSDNPLRQQALTAVGYARLLQEQVGNVGLALAAVGCAWLAWRKRPLLALLGIAWLTVVVFVRLYRVADAPVFLIPSFMMVALLIGAGVHAIAGSAAALSEAADALALARLAGAMALAVLAPALALVANGGSLDRSHDWTVHNYAIDVLSQPLPSDATIVGILGEVTLLRYYQETQGIRPEIATIAADTDALRRAEVDRLVQLGRPVYLVRPLPGIERSYALSAVGPLIEVLAPGRLGALSPGGAAAPAVFGERIALLSYRLSGLPSGLVGQAFPQDEKNAVVESGGRLRLTLTWQAAQALSKDYAVTVRLRAPSGRLLWQSDGRPVHGNYTTSAWRPGEAVTDCYDVLAPVGTPPGSYDVEVGVYDSATMQMLAVNGSPGLLTIGPVTVVRPAAAIDVAALPLRRPTPQAGLTIAGTVLDYSLQSIGVQHVVRSNLQNEFTLHGYGFSSSRLAPGQALDITLLWQAARPPSGDRVVFVQLVDAKGKVWASQESQPSEGGYPTGQWQRDEVVREFRTLLLPVDTPDGDYTVRAGMYDASGAPLTVMHLTRRSADFVELGSVQVRGRARSQQVPADMRHTVNARLGNVATLVGYDAGVQGRDVADGPELLVKAGERLSLRLVWRATESGRTSYTVFVHLVNAQGTVVAQDDSIPGRGTLPTTSWLRGEVLLDTYTLPVPNTAQGVHSIVLGMYDATTGRRLAVWDGSGVAVGDSLTLPTKVRVEHAP